MISDKVQTGYSNVLNLASYPSNHQIHTNVIQALINISYDVNERTENYNLHLSNIANWKPILRGFGIFE